MDVFRAMAEKGELRLRLWVMLRDLERTYWRPDLDRYRMIGAGDDHLTVRAIKRYMDGALGLARRVAAGALHRQARQHAA